MKKFRSVVALLLAFVLLCTSFTVAYADDGIMPIYDHCDICSLDFYVYDGLAYIMVDYYANYDTFLRIEASAKIQKRFLGVFWTTVDIGLPDNTWVASSTENPDYLEGIFPIEETGTYRAVFDIKFYGTTSVVDQIDSEIEAVYTGQSAT